jgi:PPM family protein phosphatase
MTARQVECPQCAADVSDTDRFCERCGAVLSGIQRVAIPRDGDPEDGPCPDCGNPTFSDGYCTRCGQRRAAPDRDEAELCGATLITDRGLEHARNEDAAAAAMLVGAGTDRPYAIAAAVCDGVSTTGDSHTAAAAASKAGVEAMVAALAASRKAHAAVVLGLAAAAEAAAAVWSGTDAATAPSCTYTAAAVVPTATGTVEIAVGNVGDSRVYWLPGPPAPAQQLTVDDSVARELITAGVPADSDAVRAGAHVLTRWLGADAEPKPWSESNVHTITTAGPGALLMCTDGLWNYLPDAEDIARFCTGTDAYASASALVEFALRAGGQDNITVVIIPIGGTS